MIYVILLVAAGILAPDLYIWDTYVRGGRAIWSVIYWVPSFLFVFLAVFAMAFKRFNAGVMNIFTALILGVALPKALFALVAWLGATSSDVLPFAEPLGYYSGVTIALVVMTLSFFGLFFGWKIITVHRVEMRFDNLPPQFDGYRIVQLTDFHIGTYHKSPDTVRKIVDKVNSLHPDAIAFTGDLVNLRPSEVDEFMPELERLKAPDGVFSVLGNHDYCAYLKYRERDGAVKASQALCAKEREMGWELLVNESRIISRGGATMAIVGVENDGKPPFPARADLRHALRDLPEGTFKVLLSHDPTHWRREVLPDSDVALTLAGHTHAMQFRIGRFSPSRFVYREWGGEYREGDRVLYVSTGVGSNLTFRFGAWPEVVEIILKSA